MKKTKSRLSWFRARGAARLTLLLLFTLQALAPCTPSAQAQGLPAEPKFVDLALPAGEEVHVENRRGGVSVEVWGEDHLALAVVAESPSRNPKRATRRGGSSSSGLPVRVERAGDALSISVARAAAPNAPRVDLRLRVPARTRLKVSTAEGELRVSGATASLSAQTISGDLSLSLPAPPDASVTAQSLNGTLMLGEGVEAPGAAARTLRGKFQARWGAGGRAVNLFSGRGHIRLETFHGGLATTFGARSSDAAGRPTGSTRLRGETAGDSDAAHAARPAPPQAAETPQEVEEDEVVRVEAELVTLNVSVIDRASGRGLTGLARSDFELAEDGVAQQIEHFESAEAPFDLLLLIDVSGSTAKVTDTIRAAAWRFVEATRPQDRIAIVTFTDTTNVITPLTADRRQLREAVNRIVSPKGDTRVYDALASAMDYLGREGVASRRRAVILMSDGLDSTLPNVGGVGSALPYEEARSRAQEFDGVLYTIWTSTEYEAFSPQDIQPETFDLVHDRMEELAGAGGGVFYEVERLEDLAGAYERVVADLGTLYSLSYRPVNKQRDGRWRAIRVRLPRHPGAVARGKRGYFAK